MFRSILLVAVALHNNTARVLLLCRLVKHLTLFAQSSALLHQLVQILTSLQNRVDGLVLFHRTHTIHHSISKYDRQQCSFSLYSRALKT